MQVLALLATAATLGLMLAVGLTSYFGTDEFNYAHAAWAIAQGQQPYRDFFLHHFPGIMQLGSLVFRLWDDPRAMDGLRWLMVPFWLLAAVAILLLNRRSGVWPALLSIPLLGSLGAWVQYGTQFRPDPVAIALFLSSLLLATGHSPRARLRSFLAGACLVFACWSSQKVIVYGLPLFLGWLVAMVQWRRRPGEPRLVSEPREFALGVLAAAIPIAGYLTITHNWRPWWEWCLYGGIVHETFYPKRSPWISLQPTLRQNWHVLGLALLGFLWMARGVWNRGARAAFSDPDVLLLACAVTTGASYFMQQAPYGWSLIAPLAFVAVLAARGLGEVVQYAIGMSSPDRRRLIIGVAGIGIAFASVPLSAVEMLRTRHLRARQEAMLANVARLTAPTDPAYDNTGYYVARPHAHFFFWTDQSARIVHRERLIREVPTAILQGGVTLRIRDRRDLELPPGLQAFLNDHFVCVLGDVCLWGHTYAGLGQKPAAFTAVRDARYYVTPASAISGRQLRIDGRPVEQPTFHLTRGQHEISWSGGAPAPELSLLWLPRTGELLEPGR
ncbi:MAG TPA: hypothetical protein VIG95_02900 [Gemmatimonadales bacterium]